MAVRISGMAPTRADDGVLTIRGHAPVVPRSFCAVQGSVAELHARVPSRSYWGRACPEPCCPRAGHLRSLDSHSLRQRYSQRFMTEEKPLEDRRRSTSPWIGADRTAAERIYLLGLCVAHRDRTYRVHLQAYRKEP